VKRALEVAAAGAHNIINDWPARFGQNNARAASTRYSSALTFEESIETTKIHSVAGLLPPNSALVATRPFRSPHHTISDSALVGGGTIPHPGRNISLTSRHSFFGRASGICTKRSRSDAPAS